MFDSLTTEPTTLRRFESDKNAHHCALRVSAGRGAPMIHRSSLWATWNDLIREVSWSASTAIRLQGAVRLHIAVLVCLCSHAQTNTSHKTVSVRQVLGGLKVNVEHKMSLGLSVRKDGISAPITSSVSAEVSFDAGRGPSLEMQEGPLRESLAHWYIKDLTMMIAEIDSISMSCHSPNAAPSGLSDVGRRSVQEEIESVRKYLKSELGALIRQSGLPPEEVSPVPHSYTMSSPSVDDALAESAKMRNCGACKTQQSLWARGIRITTNVLAAPKSGVAPSVSRRTTITAGVALSLNRDSASVNGVGRVVDLLSVRQRPLTSAIGQLKTDERVEFLRHRIDELRTELRAKACSGDDHSKWLHEKFVLYLVEFYYVKRSIMDRAVESNIVK